jgi:hypothetical protein
LRRDETTHSRKIYEETKNMSREEYLIFIRKQVDESPFGKLLKKYDVKHR